jgi:hypothetical protein
MYRGALRKDNLTPEQRKNLEDQQKAAAASSSTNIPVEKPKPIA